MSDERGVELPSPDFDDMVWRPPVRADAQAIVLLHDACFEVDDTYRIVESEVLEHWDSASIDPSTDALVGFAGDGDLVVAIWTVIPDGAETKHRAYSYENRIHPSVRSEEMSDFVLAWWEARARQRFDAVGDDLVRCLFHVLFEHQTEEIAFLESHGYVAARYYHELGRSLSVPLRPAVFPDTIDIRPMEGHRGDAHDVYNEAFRDHWGSQPATVERWNEAFNEFYVPDASFVAYEGERPVAYVFCLMYPHDFEDRGWRHAWIQALGTLRSHRKQGVATGLMTLAMEAMVADGMEYAILGVDTDNPSGAYGLYTSLGFEPMRAEVLLSKPA